MRPVSKKLRYRHTDPLIRYIALVIIFPAVGDSVRQTAFFCLCPIPKAETTKGHQQLHGPACF